MENEIYRYLNGEMSGEELAEFEAKMQGDASMREEVAFSKTLFQHANEIDPRDLETISQGANAYFEERALEAKRPRRRWVMGIAAGIALLCVVGYLLWPSSKSTDSIFQEAFSPMENLISSMGAAADGMYAYDQGDFSTAAEKLAQVPTQDEMYNGMQVYLGISLLGSGQAKEAAEVLERHLASTSGQPLFEKDAQWYLALAWLKMSDVEQAKKHLQGIAEDPTHPRQSAAADILQQLKEI